MLKRFYLGILLLSFFLISCRSKTEPDTNTRISAIINEYASEIDADSASVTTIDTLSSMGYARLMMEMLESMQFDLEYQFKDALFTGNDSLANEIEFSMMEIDDMSEFFFVASNDPQTPNRDLLLYMVSALFYKNNATEMMHLFITPDFKIHHLDPFNHNLLEENAANEPLI